MTGVSYSLANFVDGSPIVPLPIMEGASWSAMLNRPDSVSCSIDLRDEDAQKLDLRSASEPNKTILLAQDDEGHVLAWGLIGDDGREWDDDARKLTLTAEGVNSAYFGQTVIAPPDVLTAPLTTLDPEGYPQINPALNTTISGVSHGTIGKRLIAQRLAFPGAPTVFDLPPDEVGFRTQTYTLAAMKSIGSALDDLVKQEGGCDFAFDAYPSPSGLGVRYGLRHGSEAEPRIGAYVGVWTVGGESSPITKLKTKDSLAAGASLGLMTAGRSSGAALISRLRNTTMIANGYPPIDLVDNSHSDVSEIATLDRYNAENMADAATAVVDISFTVRGDAHPSVGQYRPGDRVTLDVAPGNPWLPEGSTEIRIMSMSGDETAEDVRIGAVYLNG